METSSRARWLSFPRVLWLSLLAAILLALPTVWLGFFTDDFCYLLPMEGQSRQGSP